MCRTKEVDKLYTAVKDAQKLLKDAWLRPATMKKVTTKKKNELDKLLRALINQEVRAAPTQRRTQPVQDLISTRLDAPLVSPRQSSARPGAALLPSEPLRPSHACASRVCLTRVPHVALA